MPYRTAAKGEKPPVKELKVDLGEKLRRKFELALAKQDSKYEKKRDKEERAEKRRHKRLVRFLAWKKWWLKKRLLWSLGRQVKKGNKYTSLPYKCSNRLEKKTYDDLAKEIRESGLEVYFPNNPKVIMVRIPGKY